MITTFSVSCPVSDPAEDDGGAVQNAGLRFHLQATADVPIYKPSPVHLRGKHHMKGEDQDEAPAEEGSTTDTHLDMRCSGVGVDEQQRRRPLAAEQEVKRVIVSHGSHVEQVAPWRRGGGAGVQRHRQLKERRRNKRPSNNNDGNMSVCLKTKTICDQPNATNLQLINTESNQLHRLSRSSL